MRGIAMRELLLIVAIGNVNSLYRVLEEKESDTRKIPRYYTNVFINGRAFTKLEESTSQRGTQSYFRFTMEKNFLPVIFHRIFSNLAETRHSLLFLTNAGTFNVFLKEKTDV